jgi:hypothetical protein
VLKSAVDRDLVEACRAAMRGEPFLYPGAVRALMREYLERARAGETLDGEMLTPREEETLKLVAEAHTNDEIAPRTRPGPDITAPCTTPTCGRHPMASSDAAAHTLGNAPHRPPG